MADELTIAELAARTGISVRTIRFYAGMGLIPLPTVRGRLGLYDERHIARLELVRDLQKLGFTLTAIEGYLARIPLERSPEDLALHRALLAPWLPEQPETVDRAELDARAGRTLDDEELARLTMLGVIGRHGAPDDAQTWTLTSTRSSIEHMFDIGQDLEYDWPPPVTAPPEEVIDCLVEDQPGAGEPVRWSEYVPGGLLADILSRPSDGDPQHRDLSPWSASGPGNASCTWLPATLAALEQGRITLAKARVIDAETMNLSHEHTAQVERQVLATARKQTPGTG